MKTYISILRGINVGGHKLIKMLDLKQLYIELGFKKIETYIQSGNVVFQGIQLPKKELELTIKRAIKEKFGFEVPVLVIEFETLSEIVKNNSFKEELSKDPNCMHVTFLSEKPELKLLSSILELKFNEDEIQSFNEVIYIYCPNGYGKTKFTNTFFESKLKVDATTRNWKTTNELVLIAEKMNS